MWLERSKVLRGLNSGLGWTIGCLVAAMALATSTVHAEIPSDFHVQSDRFDMEEEVSDAMSSYNYQYIQWLLQQGYPVPSIILHATSRGMSISDVVYLLTRAKPEMAQDYYDHALEMLPSLPGWVCESRDGMEGRYYKRYTLDELGTTNSVRKVAERFFQDGGRLKPFPAWEKGESHMKASISELIALSNEESERAKEELDKEDSWWYQSYRLPIGEGTPLFVSLYKDDKRIVIDADTKTLQALRSRGRTQVPIVIVYNGKNFIPTSHIDKATDAEAGKKSPESGDQGQQKEDYIDYNDGEVTASEVIDRFFSKGLKLTPPREWHQVDHHLNVPVKELRELFESAEARDMDPGRLEEKQKQFKNGGLDKPLLITLDGNSGERWVDDKALIAAAESMGMDSLPTVFLYHDSNRWPCGVPAACSDWVCDAAVAGGASSSVCGPGTTTGTPPGTSTNPGGFYADDYDGGGDGDGAPTPPASPN